MQGQAWLKKDRVSSLQVKELAILNNSMYWYDLLFVGSNKRQGTDLACGKREVVYYTFCQAGKAKQPCKSNQTFENTLKPIERKYPL